MLVKSITDLIGNTPLLEIPETITGLNNIKLYAKLEMLNPFGSVKDRIAWAMLRDHLDEIKENKKVVLENSSGNTAKALQAICACHNISFKLISALVKIPETKDILKVIGADMEEIPSASDCFDPNDPNDPQYIIQHLVEHNPEQVFFTSQFTNKANPEEHYHSTAQEILNDLAYVDYIIGGLGTSGSTLGIARRIREKFSNLLLFGLTAEKYDFIPGIRTIDEMWEAGIFQEAEYNRIQSISSSAAITGMLTLIRKCGILCGPTSGANYQGALSILKEEDLKLQSNSAKKNAVFIVCDRLDPYISYIKQRAPELFGQVARKDLSFGLNLEEIEAAPVIQPENLENWTRQNNPMIIDVRTPLAFQQGSLSEAINIPLEIMEQLIYSGNAFEKQRNLLLVCQIGLKTRLLTAALNAQGYRVYHLKGGIKSCLEKNIKILNHLGNKQQDDIYSLF